MTSYLYSSPKPKTFVQIGRLESISPESAGALDTLKLGNAHNTDVRRVAYSLADKVK